MAPEVYNSADYTAAADIYSFSLILYEVFVGEPVFPETTPLPALSRKASQGDRPELPESMDWTIQEIIKRGWSVDPDARGSFEGIFEALQGIGFKMTLAVNMPKVAKFVARVDASGAPRPATEFAPLGKKGNLRYSDGSWTYNTYDIPDGIIAYLTKVCGGNVDDNKVVEIRSGSFEKETIGANPHSGTYGHHPYWPAKNAADLETISCFESAYRINSNHIPPTKNNWVCYDFKERRIVPTHYAIRTSADRPGGYHLRSWLIETSADGESWREVARQENNQQLNGRS
jgi:hypothetical protein